MNQKIFDNIENPEQLEKLYRENKRDFERAFFELYPIISSARAADFWKARLESDRLKDGVMKISYRDVLFVILACALAGFLIKIPTWFGINAEVYPFYERNAGLIVFTGLTLFAFLTKNTTRTKHVLISAAVFILAAVYINLLPVNSNSQSINLAYIHLPLMIWCLYGLIFTDFNLKDKSRRIEYIKHNGDLAILMAVIFGAGGVLAGITLGLFSVIGLQIDDFYMNYVVVLGLVSAPVFASAIIRMVPQIAGKITQIIATIFSPLVLITLVAYLVSIVVTGKDPYNDRDFLIIFNIMLLGVVGIVVFSISETASNKRQRLNELTLLGLSLVTLIIDVVALSAIIYRLGEFGMTPNRIAILGSNLLFLGNLTLITFDLFRVNFNKRPIQQIERTIANYLPVYALWTVFVVFILPGLFGMS